MKLEDLPLHFYKYRSLAGDQKQFTRQIIKDNALYWASPLSFNDPFECAPVPEIPKGRFEKESRLRRLIRDQAPMASEATRREQLKIAMSIPSEVYEENLQRDLPHILRSLTVCSLSEIPDSVLMWSHYADCHRGICLEFRPLTRDSTAPHIPEKTYFEFAFPITYSAERPVISVPVADKAGTLERTVLTKADFWQYEKEWRLIDNTGEAGPRPFPPECLDAVILGARMSQKDRAEVRKWVAQRPSPIAVREARFDRRLFRLHIE